MKHIIITLAMLISALYGGNAQTENLENIEQKIHNGFAQAQQQGSIVPLSEITKQLTELRTTKKQNIIGYWLAYAKYYAAIYHISRGDRESSEKAINHAVELLDGLNNKTSEDYALLSLTQGFAIQFKNMVKMIFLSQQIRRNGELAIKKDAKNLRAYYTLASNDFYTPEKFGGGKHTEEYLLKAIQLPEQKIKNVCLPAWGKQEAYELLVRWYIRKKQWAKAKKYHADAIVKYPNSYMLNQLTKQLKNK